MCYNAFTVLQMHFFVNDLLKKLQSIVIVFTFSIDAHIIACLINFQLQYDYIEALFFGRSRYGV